MTQKNAAKLVLEWLKSEDTSADKVLDLILDDLKYRFHVITIDSKGQAFYKTYDTEDEARESIYWLHSHSELARIFLFHGEALGL